MIHEFHGISRFKGLSDHLEQIRNAESPETLTVVSRATAPLAAGLIRTGIPPSDITLTLSLISDSMAVRFIEFAVTQLGPPPCRFSFLVFGSEGRNEQTLTTDQDNAIVYEDLTDDQGKAARAYFLTLGKNVCQGLSLAGYALCKGDTMAMNPRFCQSLSLWKQDVDQWLLSAEERDLMKARMLFDVRGVLGDDGLAGDFRTHLENRVAESPRFIRILANHILQAQVPLGFLGRIVVEKDGPRRGSFSIKNAMTPLVDFVRVYAMKHGVSSTHTVTRLDDLLALRVLSAGTHQGMKETFEGLMDIRLNTQARAVGSAWSSPSNDVFPNSLNPNERGRLRNLLENLRTYKIRVGYDFTGGMPV